MQTVYSYFVWGIFYRQRLTKPAKYFIGWISNHILMNEWYFHPCLNFNSGLINTLRPRQNGRRFADDTFKRIFLNENVRIPIKISLKFVPKGPINNNPALVQIMAWRRSGDKPLSESMMVRLLTHICVTRPQWVNSFSPGTKWPPFRRRYFQMHFCEWKVLYFD